jgi:DegV family protein with EDD domain
MEGDTAMSVKIITDSAADLPKEIAKQHGIEVLPLLVYLGEQEFRDGETMNPKEMFKGMREGKVYKTAQVPLQVFREQFQQMAERDEVCIYVAFSSALSGTYQSAVLARNEILEDYPDFKLEVIDTKCASMGFGLVVLKAAQLAAEGRSQAEILEAIRYHAEHMEHIFTVDNLEYLHRGGRVSRTAAFIGGLLNIKPVLHVDDGRLIPIEKLRGRRKVLDRMVAIMQERGTRQSEQVIGISHGDDLETAEALRDMIREKFGSKEFIISQIGGAVGAHSGPGTLALFFLNQL